MVVVVPDEAAGNKSSQRANPNEVYKTPTTPYYLNIV